MEFDSLEFDPIGLEGVDNIDQITTPGSGGDLTCETCGLALNYGGRGRKPRFCSDHKPGARSATGSTPAKRKRGKKRGAPGLETAGSLAWGGIGYSLQLTSTTPQQEAAGRVMQIQAPDAGRRIARILDPYVTKWRWLQAISGGGGPMGDVAALVLPPLLIGAVAGSEGAQKAARPVLQALLAPIAASIIEAQAEQEKLMEQMTGSGEAGEQARAATVEILDMVFSGLGGGQSEDAES
jgi:hypothetical protein